MVIAIRRAIPFLPEPTIFPKVNRGCRDEQDREVLDEVGEWRGIFERMGGIRVKEPSAIGPEHA